MDAVKKSPRVSTAHTTARHAIGDYAEATNEASDQVALSRVVTRDYVSTVGARLREGRFLLLSFSVWFPRVARRASIQ